MYWKILPPKALSLDKDLHMVINPISGIPVMALQWRTASIWLTECVRRMRPLRFVGSVTSIMWTCQLCYRHCSYYYSVGDSFRERLLDKLFEGVPHASALYRDSANSGFTSNNRDRQSPGGLEVVIHYSHDSFIIGYRGTNWWSWPLCWGHNQGWLSGIKYTWK